MQNKNCFIGVDLGGTKIYSARFEDGKIVAVSLDKTPSKGSKEILFEALENSIRSVWSDDVGGIGIGVPSVVDRKEGIVYNVVHIPGLDVFPLAELIGNSFSRPVYVDNDANCFALGERVMGVGKNYENFVGLTLGTGLGGGIIQNGRLLQDRNCGSGEFGMLPYQNNVLEYYCSGSFFKNVYGVDGREMNKRAQDGDQEALEAYQQLGKHVAAAVKMVVFTVDPEMIVFGGSLAKSYVLFEKSMYEYLNDFPYPRSIERLRIFFSDAKVSAVVGAAALCPDFVKMNLRR